MPNAEPRRDPILGRCAAALQLLAVMFNLLIAALWALSFIWAGIGLLWAALMIPLVWEGVVAIRVLIHGHHPHSVRSAGFGVVASVLNVNLITLALELVALVLLVVSRRAFRGTAPEASRR